MSHEEEMTQTEPRLEREQQLQKRLTPIAAEEPAIESENGATENPKPVKQDTGPVSESNQPQMKEMADSILAQKYNDLKRNFDDANQECRDQYAEIRNLKKHNTELLETLRAHNGSTEKQKDVQRLERDRLEEQVELLEHSCFHYKQQMHKQKALIESLTLQTREANEEKAEAEANARRLTRQNKELHENLTECKDDLLRLQPPGQISDSRLSEEYLSLHQQISKWVDDETEDSLCLEQRFENLSTSNEEIPELLRKCLSGDLFRLGKKYPQCQPLIIRYMIHCYLEQHVFRDDILLFGLDSNFTSFLRGVEQGMRKLEPHRDAVTIRHWRSETLRGLSQMVDFNEEQRAQACSLATSLYKALSCLLPDSGTKTDGWKDLLDHVIVPAIQVSISMRISTTTYRLTSRMAGKPPDQASIMYAHELQRCQMVDVASHKIIRSDSALKVAGDGRIGEQMLVLQPALLRYQKEGGNTLVLCKPIVLVKLDEPMGRKNKGMRKLQSWFGAEAVD
ncbi:hypothetical protein MMC07_005711 [Pseudocyphellaria aurata]|nr:hypothetical protein [Pseudocyphellaria aurata]